MHYLVDNIFEHTEIGMMRPLKFFPDWFSSAGLIYLCPQLAALTLIKADKQGSHLYFDLLPEYLSEANLVVNRVAERCHFEARSYILLNADNSSAPFGLGPAAVAAGAPGVVTVVRSEAPATGSKCRVIYPNDEPAPGEM